MSESMVGDVALTVRTRGSRRAVRASMVAVLATALASIGLAGLHPAGAAAKPKPPPVEYYLALGDSMAAGTGASTGSHDYVNVLYQHELARYPGLQVVNLACGGATTGSMVAGPGCSYASGTQLGDAEAFLRAHAGHVAMVTIDIGANNVDGCLNASGISTSCVTSGLSQITTYLPQILDGLSSSYPDVAIYGMDYYDPFLDQWLSGTSGQTVATESEAFAVDLNSLLGQLFGADDAAMADPATLFQTSNFSLTGTYNGATVPENVALICAWTLMCSGNNIHPNDSGHAEVDHRAARRRAEEPVLGPVGGQWRTSGLSVVAGAGGRHPAARAPTARFDRGHLREAQPGRQLLLHRPGEGQQAQGEADHPERGHGRRIDHRPLTVP
jgi:lysophospholipase L1-like esterase